MICDSCIHKEVCYEKEEDRQALKHCSDYFNYAKELEIIKGKIMMKSRPQWERLIVNLADCEIIINDIIAELKGENNGNS